MNAAIPALPSPATMRSPACSRLNFPNWSASKATRCCGSGWKRSSNIRSPCSEPIQDVLPYRFYYQSELKKFYFPPQGRLQNELTFANSLMLTWTSTPVGLVYNGFGVFLRHGARNLTLISQKDILPASAVIIGPAEIIDLICISQRVVN